MIVKPATDNKIFYATQVGRVIYRQVKDMHQMWYIDFKYPDFSDK